jgi:hypothetical protein
MMGKGRDDFIGGFLFFVFARQIFAEQLPAVLIVMAIDAEIFPIGSVGRIVEVVSVFMVDREEVSVRVVKLPPAFGADQAVDFERTLSIIVSRNSGFLKFPEHLFERFLISGFWGMAFVNPVEPVSHKKLRGKRVTFNRTF